MIVILPGFIRRMRPDILFCAGNTYAVVAVAMKLLFGTRCPPVVAKISNDLRRQDLPRPARLLYHLWCRIQGCLIDHFVALSPAMQAEIGELMQVERHRISSIHDPALDQRRLGQLRRFGAAARASQGRGRRFLAIGRLVRQKNLKLLLRAFTAAAAPDDTLTILGDGAERETLSRWIEQASMSDRIDLAGHVEDVDRRLAAADILVLPSLYEGVPAAVIEALAAGLPIIASRCCVSMPQLVDATGGITVPVGDLRALEQAIERARPRREPHAAAAGLAELHVVERAARSYLAAFAQVRRVGSTGAEAQDHGRSDRSGSLRAA